MKFTAALAFLAFVSVKATTSAINVKIKCQGQCWTTPDVPCPCTPKGGHRASDKP
ncbi:hypothetical protein Vi05172_g5735 [Venturia inaequalis]|nr:hypothetical protein Vi05172_g5735 [Venturia inaequalis]